MSWLASSALPLTTVQREVNRLSGSGLIRERRVGRSRLVSANPASRYTRPLTELVSLAFGPQFVIGEEFQALGRDGRWRSTGPGLRATRASRALRRTTSTCSSSGTWRAATCTRRPSGPSSASGCRSIPCCAPRSGGSRQRTRSSSRSAPLRSSGSSGEEPREGRRLMRWSTGEATVERLLAAGHIERVQGAQADGASWLDRARRGLDAARVIAETRPTAASSSPMTRPGRHASPFWRSRACVPPRRAAIMRSRK